MFVMGNGRGGSGTGVSLGWDTCVPATHQARERRSVVIAVIGGLPTCRAGEWRLI